MEPEWVWVRELFFEHFMAKKAEALRLKEESPLDYMSSSQRSSIGLQASTCMNCQNSLGGSRRGVIFMGCWSREAKSRSAPT